MIVEKGNIFSQLQKKFGSDTYLYKEILVEQMFCTPTFFPRIYFCSLELSKQKSSTTCKP